jgi:hypothetical protein
MRASPPNTRPIRSLKRCGPERERERARASKREQERETEKEKERKREREKDRGGDHKRAILAGIMYFFDTLQSEHLRHLLCVCVCVCVCAHTRALVYTETGVKKVISEWS